MDEDILFAGTFIIIILSVLGTLLIFEDNYIRNTSDYMKCLNYCGNEFSGGSSGDIATNKLACQRECSHLSECYIEEEWSK